MLVTGSEDATARLWATRTEETECLGVLKYQLKPYSQHILATHLLLNFKHLLFNNGHKH